MNLHLAVWLLLCLIWGSTWIFIKLGLDDWPPFTFAGMRFLLAAAILWVIVFLRKDSLPRTRRDWLLIAWLGVTSFAVNYGLVFWGENRIPSGLTAVLQAMIPAFGLLLAHYLLPNERITAAKLVGVAIGIAGVAVIFADQMNVAGTSALWGSAAIIVSALVVAYTNVLVKLRCGHLSTAPLVAGQMTFAIVPLFAVGWFVEGSPLKLRWTLQAAASLVYLAVVGSVIAFLLYYWLVRKIDVTKTMLISLVTPVVALLIGWLVRGEAVSWRLALGSAAILSGIGLIVAPRRAKQI
ncbi:MAG TPA: EamA family transporter [Blastocatellia bacterium]|nr:EamA family transporter [Blastocatellia bacterium]